MDTERHSTMLGDSNYSHFVRMLALANDPRVFLNSDEDHALSVLVELFNKAQNCIRIFAGCLCKHVGNRPEYITALSDFIERGGTLKILLNAFDEEAAKESNLFKRLAYYQSSEKTVYVKRSSAHPYRTKDPEKKEVHFTIGDLSSYRIETDIEQRTAECSFNSPEIAKGIADFFDSLFVRPDVEDIDLQRLFDYDNK